MRLEVSDQGILMELQEYFTFEVPGFRFTPAFKNGFWDGKIRVFNFMQCHLYVGLLYELVNFCRDYDYELILDPALEYKRTVEMPDLVDWVKEQDFEAYGEKIKAHDFQVIGLYHAMNSKRCVLESPTRSGKSLIMYMVSLQMMMKDMRSLIVVPTTSLVEQMYGDFAEYSKGESEDKVHRIYQKQSKTTDRPIVVTTWQSVYEMPEEWLNQFDCVMIDECHGVKAPSLKKLLEKSNAEYRFGFTGTQQDPEAHRFIIEGLLGRTIVLTNMAELMDREIVAQLKVECVTLNYPDNVKAKRNYNEEIDFLIDYQHRNEWLAKLACKLKGNTFMLFSRKKHGEELLRILREMGREAYIVYGPTDTIRREEIRKSLEKKEGVTVVASYQVFSAGISVRKLHHVIAAGPAGKTKIRLLQSIGRALGKHHTKDIATFWDISDDLSIGKKPNFTLNHFKDRVKLYASQGFLYHMRQAHLSALGLQQVGKSHE